MCVRVVNYQANQAASLEQPEHGDDEDEEGQDEAGGDDEPGQPLVLRPLDLQVRRPGGFVIRRHNFWTRCGAVFSTLCIIQDPPQLEFVRFHFFPRF